MREYVVFVYTSGVRVAAIMPIFSRVMFRAVEWKARHGLREEQSPAAMSAGVEVGATSTEDTAKEKKEAARRTGIRGETYAYWYLRKLGYVFVARNWEPRMVKGEIDLIGYDGETLAFVEVRTRTVREEFTALPELSVTAGKQQVVARAARMFLAERRVKGCACRFDVVAIDNEPGRPPVVRLHKDAFSPQMETDGHTGRWKR